MYQARNAYVEKLRDPRWQKKRLEIMQRDKFACRNCGDTETTLNVHHAYYAANRDPWAYPSIALLTLCQPCHSAETERMRFAEKAIGPALRSITATASDIEEIIASLAAIKRRQENWFGPPSCLVRAIKERLADVEGLMARARELEDMDGAE